MKPVLGISLKDRRSSLPPRGRAAELALLHNRRRGQRRFWVRPSSPRVSLEDSTVRRAMDPAGGVP